MSPTTRGFGSDGTAPVLDTETRLGDARRASLRPDVDKVLDPVLDIDRGLRAILPRHNGPTAPRSDSPTELGTFADDVAIWPEERRLAFRVFVPHRELERLRTNAFFHVRVFDLATDEARDRNSAIASVQDLIRYMSHDYVFDYDNFDALYHVHRVSRAVDRDRGCDRDLERVRTALFDVADWLGKNIQHDLYRALNRVRDLAHLRRRDIPTFGNRDDVRAFTHSGDHARALATAVSVDSNVLGNTNFVLTNTRIRVATTKEQIRRTRAEVRVFAHSLATAVAVLHDATTDFAGADLSQIDFAGAYLSSVRWSTTTRWPPTWESAIARASVEIGPGLYEIRGIPEKPTR